MREEMQRQEALNSAENVQRTGKSGQMTTGHSSKDVPDLRLLQDRSKNGTPIETPYFLSKDKMEPMELYEELPSEMEVGVSAYEIDRSRFKDKMKSHHIPRPPLPPPSPTKMKKGPKGRISPKPRGYDQEQEMRKRAQEEEKRRNLEQQQRLIEENQKLLDERQRELEEQELQRLQEEEQRIKREKEEKQALLFKEEQERKKKLAEEEEQERLFLAEEEKRRQLFEAEQEQVRQNNERKRIQDELDWSSRHQDFGLPLRVDLLNRPFFSPPPVFPSMPPNFSMGNSIFTDPFKPHQIGRAHV